MTKRQFDKLQASVSSLLAQATALISEAKDDAREEWDDRSGNYQESTKGVAVDEFIDALGAWADSLDEAASAERPDFPDAKRGAELWRCGACGCHRNVAFSRCPECRVPDQCYKVE